MSKCWASPQRQWEASYAQREWDGLAGENLHPTHRWDKAPQRIGTWVRFWKQAAITKIKNGKKDFAIRRRVNANPITEFWSWCISIYILYFLRCLPSFSPGQPCTCTCAFPSEFPFVGNGTVSNSFSIPESMSSIRFFPLCSLEYWRNNHSSLFYPLGVCWSCCFLFISGSIYLMNCIFLFSLDNGFSQFLLNNHLHFKFSKYWQLPEGIC